jgi:hypothetical protein
MADLLDVERRMDRTSFPGRWDLLQGELRRRREAGDTDGSRRLSVTTAQEPVLLGRGLYVGLHLMVCPVLGGVGACFLDSPGEGSGCLPFVATPLIALFSLASVGTHNLYLEARRPGRFLLISVAVMGLGAPMLMLLSMMLLVRAIELLR